MRRGGSPEYDEMTASHSYFTYRPLSNLPTPPPTYRDGTSSPTNTTSSLDDDVDYLDVTYRGAAIHLVNMIPSSASLAAASVPLVQAILSRANLPLETVALAVCILDSLDAKFARAWRLSCPLSSPSLPLPLPLPANNRHSMPPTPRQLPHIDSVQPELIVMAALAIAVKFTEDPHQTAQQCCGAWGRGLWSPGQLNATERCIMESLNYRIMPLCEEDCISDAMVDMQLAARQEGYAYGSIALTPPRSLAEAKADGGGAGHGRSKTMVDPGTLGLGISMA